MQRSGVARKCSSSHTHMHDIQGHQWSKLQVSSPLYACASCILFFDTSPHAHTRLAPLPVAPVACLIYHTSQHATRLKPLHP